MADRPASESGERWWVRGVNGKPNRMVRAFVLDFECPGLPENWIEVRPVEPASESGERMKPVCRCGWQGDPFPRAMLDTYDHYCGDCGEPIDRFVPASESGERITPTLPAALDELMLRLEEAESRALEAERDRDDAAETITEQNGIIARQRESLSRATTDLNEARIERNHIASALSRAERDLENERRQGENLLRAGREVEARLSRAEAALREIEGLLDKEDREPATYVEGKSRKIARSIINPPLSNYDAFASEVGILERENDE